MGNIHRGEVFADAEPPSELTDFDQEAIQLPSAIQPHGILLAVRHSDMRVVYVSANAGEFFGMSPREMLGRPLPEFAGEEFVAAIAGTLSEGRKTAFRRLAVSVPGSGRVGFHLRAHRVPDLICVELEPSLEGERWDALALRMEAVIEALRGTDTRADLCAAATREIRRLTGYDSVKIYRLHGDDHGEVVAEDRDPEVPSQLDQHSPVPEVLSRVGTLSLAQRTRLLADVHYQPVPVLGHPELSERQPLDMSNCGLRGASPHQIQSMKDSGVGASFVISLVHQQELWGLILCHHRTARLMPPEVRGLCDLLGQIISMLIGVTQKNEEYAEFLASRGLLERLGQLMPPGSQMAKVLADHGAELCGPLRAHGALIHLGGHSRVAGIAPPLEDAVALMNALRGHVSNGLATSNQVGKILPEFAHMAPLASGALMILIGDSQEDGVVWFRPAVPRTVSRGTAPRPVGGLVPRTSLAEWTDRLHGRSLPWTDSEISMAYEFQHSLTAILLRHAEARQAQLLCYIDALTGLPNRRVVLDRLAERQNHVSKGSAYLIFIDIDRFKMVNDTLGHSTGDDLLLQVGRRLNERAGVKHLVARLGGDEFVVFCENVSLAEAREVAQAIVLSFQSPFLLNGKPFRCATSIGVAPAEGNGIDTIADVLHAADSAMYAAKQRGGNQFVVFENPLRDEMMRQIHLEQDLFHAIERGEMRIHFQPQLSVEGQRLMGFEALLRWEHPVYGSISPSEFIPMAEYTGHIQAVGTWVLGESLRQIGSWRQRYQPDLFVAVNVSVKQLAANDFVERVRHSLAENRMPSEALHLEVTESLLMQASAEPQLRLIQSLGVKIAIDDFGTGYSSLSYLQRLAVSELKLDRTFLESVGSDERKTALFGAIVRMAHALDLVVIAEGIEEAAQLDCIRRCGCDGAQGYLLSRPISAEGVESMFLTEWKDGLLPATSH